MNKTFNLKTNIKKEQQNDSAMHGMSENQATTLS